MATLSSHSVAIVSACILLAYWHPCRADDPSADDLFRKGRDAIVNGDTRRGCALLAESDRLEPSPGAKLSLAICEEQLSHFARAWVLHTAVLQAVSADDDRVAIVRRHLDAIRPKLSFVTITIGGPLVAGTRIASDVADLTTADLGVALPFDPGQHYFEISAPGHSARRIERILRPGTQEHVTLTLDSPRKKVELRPLPREVRSTSSNVKSLAIAIEGTAGAFLLTGLSTGLLAIDEKNRMNSACVGSICSERGLRAAARGSAFAAVSTATLVSAAVSGALGAAILLLGSRHKAPAQASDPLTVSF